ncbi:hypothetical protein ACFWXK_38365 [Streptomyces sp. NPDC059070]|uniref:hypothetical protein n=1 Tax=Streptomyces sp. NPDC059070 TaxID=3346713 RepID=UPI00367BD1C3
MNDEDALDTEDNEGLGQEPEPRRGSGASIDLSSIITPSIHAAAWDSFVERQVEPLRRQFQISESMRRSIADAIGPAMQTAINAGRQYQAATAPVLALQTDLSHRWHSHIADVVRNVSLTRRLLDQLAATAALFLPDNLSGLDSDDLSTVLALSQDDGLSLAWAPRADIVKALLPLGTRAERSALLAERRDDVLDDIDASLTVVTHPELVGMVTILRAAIATARAGFGEGGQALAGNVLETAMKRHGNAWIRNSFPQAAYPRGGGHHGTIGSALDDADDWSDLTLLQFKHYLVLAGMRNTFGPATTQDTFNRHNGAHRAGPDSYRPEFALPAVLLAHALLRALDQDLEHPDGGEEDET